jgi:hypothetical protein
LKPQGEIFHDQSDLSTVSSLSSPISQPKPSARLERLLDSVVAALWNRDGLLCSSDYGSAYFRVRESAFWYLRFYMSSLLHPISNEEETFVALASVFIAFKAADFIPGHGRIKMNQLLDAFEKSRGRLRESDVGPLIQQICQTEMEIISLCGFNFSPC